MYVGGMCNRSIMMTNPLTKCYKRWKRQRKRVGKKWKEETKGEIERKTRGKHLGTKGS